MEKNQKIMTNTRRTSKIEKLVNFLVLVSLLLILPAAVIGMYNSYENANKIKSMPKDFPMQQKLEMIEKYDRNIIVVDSLKKRVKILEQKVKAINNQK